jgi:hypothetical protein
VQGATSKGTTLGHIGRPIFILKGEVLTDFTLAVATESY